MAPPLCPPKALIASAVISVSLSLVGCGGGGSDAPPSVQTFTIGGSVSGLAGTVVLQDNGADTVSIAANGAFTFTNAVSAGGHYAVTVSTQPTGQTCAVTAGSGTASGNVSTVSVSCTKNQYAIGGAASGLIRPAVLQDNLGDNLTVTADGAFVFPSPIAAGGAYSVTVLTSPPGEVCEVQNGTGTAGGNVTSVSLSCAADASAFFVPFKATGQILAPGGTYIGPWPPPTNGTNGLMVIASDAISAAPVFVTKELTDVIGLSINMSVGTGGSVSAGVPSTLVYNTKGASGGDHLWALDLSAGSSLVPRQVSNLTGSFIGTPSCGYLQAFKNLSDPTSAFFILAIPTDTLNVCSGSPSSINKVLVRLSDSASTTPTPSPVGPDNLLALYAPDGTLAGFIGTDTSQHLVFYADETFTNPKVLLSDVGSLSIFQAPPASTMMRVSSQPGSAMLVVSTSSATSGTLYRVDYTGAISSALYAFQGSWDSVTQDAKYFYFNDVVATAAATTSMRFVQVPWDGSAAGQILYTEAGSTSTQRPYLEASTGSELIMLREPQIDSSTGAITSPGLLQTLPTGTAATPQTIASVPSSFSAQLVGNDLYVLESKNGTDLSYAPAQSTLILTLDGTVVQPLLPDSSFPFSYGDLVSQVKGITDPGGDGGGSLYVLDPTSPTVGATQVLSPDGSAFTIPTKSHAPSLLPLGNSGVAVGIAGYATQNAGVIYDESRHVIVPVSLPSTDVVPIIFAP